MSKSALKFMFLFLALTSVSGCTKQSAQVSKQKSVDGGSCDLQASAIESSEASQENFRCAYNALVTAGKLSAPGTAFNELATDINAINDLFKAAYAMERLFGAYNAYLSDKEAGQGVADDAKQIFDFGSGGLGKIVKSKTYNCFAKNAQAFSSFYPLFKLGLNSGGDQVSSGSLIQLASLAPEITMGISEMVDGLIDCASALDGSSNIAGEQLAEAIKHLKNSLGAAKAVAECGFAIGRGGYIIGKNSMCLADDIKRYYDSRENLDKQRDNTVNNLPVPQDDQSYTQRACMEKYGIFLNKQSFWTLSSRAGVCADYCAGKSGTASFFSSHFEEILPRSDDRQACGNDVGALTSAVNSCITFCCDQGNSCVESALSNSN